MPFSPNKVSESLRSFFADADSDALLHSRRYFPSIFQYAPRVPDKKNLNVCIICFCDSRRKKQREGRFFSAAAAKFWNRDLSSASESVFPNIFGEYFSPFILTKKSCLGVHQFFVATCRYIYLDINIHKSRRTCMISTCQLILRWWRHVRVWHPHWNLIHI